jgi:hypothetical protein
LKHDPVDSIGGRQQIIIIPAKVERIEHLREFLNL